MNIVVEKLVSWLAKQCDVAQSYRFQGREINCKVDWRGVERYVQETTGKKLPVVGGLLSDGWYSPLMPSFAYSGKKASYIVLYPGNWKRRMYFATGRKVKSKNLNPQVVLGCLLAHESRHIKQGVQDYGFKSLLIFPGLYLAPIIFLISLALLLVGSSPWWLPILSLLCYALALWTYFNDWREVDARHNARNHGVEWERFISITP